MPDKTLACVSVGSNLGDKLANCRGGVSELIAVSGSRPVAQSRIYQTEPVDDTDQDWFVNYVISFETVRGPTELIADISRVEANAGRLRTGRRFGPRILDLDILLFGDQVVDLPQLRIPHPRMHKRHFVLRPLCDIHPDVVHPVLRKTMRQLLDELDVSGQRVRVLE